MTTAPLDVMDMSGYVVGCSLPKCELVVTQAEDRPALVYQHGPNPEHVLIVDVLSVQIPALPKTILTWLYRLHLHEAGLPYPEEGR